ncbi:MAG: endonuclease domain-containing protein [Bacteroidetes bacterium]|nr:endonuclease domain-containing protein [Bacteroidota bacterium]
MGNLNDTITREFYFGAGKEVLEKARILRNSMTPSEKIFWQKIRKKRFMGIIFRRQHPISRFIVDFYCHEARLVIEIDGLIHSNPANLEYDENRTYELEGLGLKVIRFRNDEVRFNIKEILEILKKEVIERASTLKV